MKSKNTLHTWRVELGMTAKEAAEILGVDRTTICRQEESAKVDKLYALAALAVIDGRKPEDLEAWARCEIKPRS